MKKSIFYFFILGLLAFATSCDNETETRNSENVSIDTIQETQQVPINDHSDAFKSLVKNEKGVFRGVKLGADFSEVTKLEDTTQIEEKGSDHIDYMVSLPELETAEVRYIFGASKKLIRIEVNIYPKSKGSQDSLYSELGNYFDTKYGKGSDTDMGRKWENKSSDVFIAMERKDTQKIHDISIVITSLLRQSAVILNEALPEEQH